MAKIILTDGTVLSVKEVLHNLYRKWMDVVMEGTVVNAEDGERYILFENGDAVNSDETAVGIWEDN